MPISNPAQAADLANRIALNEKLMRAKERTRDIDHNLDGRICDMRAVLEDIEDDSTIEDAKRYANLCGRAVLEDELTRRAYIAPGLR